MAERKVSYAANQLQHLLPVLNSEGIELLIPHLQEMLENPHTALLASWHIFGLIARALGPQKTCAKFLHLLIRVFDADKSSPKHLKLYHRSFLLQLIVGLGLQNFLLHFTTILTEAIGGCKNFSLIYQEKKLSDADGVLSEENDITDETVLDASTELSKNLTGDTSHFSPDVKQEDIFELDIKDEVCASSAQIEDKLNSSCDENTESCKNDEVIRDVTSCISVSKFKTKEDINEVDAQNIYSQSAPNLSYMKRFAGDKSPLSRKKSTGIQKVETDQVKEIHSFEDSNEKNTELNVSDVSCESMLWLAHRLGPVLSARYLTRNLLRMLTLCYDSLEKRELIYLPPGNKDIKMLSLSCRWLRGDVNAFKVLECLSRIASLYGEHFIMIQYIKHISDLLHLCRKRIPTALESGLLGAMALLQHIIPSLSDRTLMDHLQDVFVKDIIYCILRLISSLRLVYPGSGQSRMMVTFRALDVIYTIGLRIGFEMARKHLSSSLQKFFSCFDKVYTEECRHKEFCDYITPSATGTSLFKEQSLIEMQQTFTPEMAFIAYIPFCKLAGGIYMEQTLKNDELIRNLCQLHDRNTAISQSNQKLAEGTSTNTCSPSSHSRNPSLGKDEHFVSGIFGKNVQVVGNRLDVQSGEDNHLMVAMNEQMSLSNSINQVNSANIPKFELSLIKRKMDNCKRHLKGNWLAYWEHESGRNDKDFHFDFKQIKLQTFIGHTGAVRAIEVLDNENSFLTSSKDKTVKLWSLRSTGNGSLQVPCQWTYNQHRKSVFAVSFLNSLRVVGSCDSTVHIWDPFMGSCIKQLDPVKGSPVTVLEAMPAPSMTFLAATTNSTIRFLDARTCKYMHEFKVNIGTTGLIRSLTVSPNGNWLSIGHSTGMLSVLDVRTGLVIGTWLGHEGEVLQLKAFNNSYFVSSSLDHSLTVWDFKDVQAKNNLKGPMEPVTSICFFGNSVITGTTGNKIGQHSSIDKTASYISTRLRSDTFKGVLTTMSLLPLNRLLLLGADNGNVVLLS